VEIPVIGRLCSAALPPRSKPSSSTRPRPVAGVTSARAGARRGSACAVRVELDLDLHAPALVALGLRPTRAVPAPNPHLDRGPISQVAPPALVPGPTDVDCHPVPHLAVADRKRVAPAASASRDRDQSQTATQQRMKR